MSINYYYQNDLNKLFNWAVANANEELYDECKRAYDNLAAHIEDQSKWRDTALRLSQKCGEAEADANRLCEEYIATLLEIGGVWWERPEEKSVAITLHNNRVASQRREK